jgi:uroporphyrin-III C-methyltransferase
LLAGVPLTFRGISRGFAVVTGHCAGEGDACWRKYAAVDTLVILMAVRNRAGIARALIRAGRPKEEPALLVERASTSEERVIDATLGDVARGVVQVESPAVFIVGAVAGLRAELRAGAAQEVEA